MSNEVDRLVHELISRTGLLNREHFLEITGGEVGEVLRRIGSVDPRFAAELEGGDGDSAVHPDPCPTCRRLVPPHIS